MALTGPMTSEQRRARINELQTELTALLAEEHAESSADMEAIKNHCRNLKTRGQAIQAVKHYRNKVGCDLGEARCAVMAL